MKYFFLLVFEKEKEGDPGDKNETTCHEDWENFVDGDDDSCDDWRNCHAERLDGLIDSEDFALRFFSREITDDGG